MRRPDPDAAAILAGLPDRMHLPVLAQAARAPDAPALADARGGWCYGELAAALQAGAAFLAARGVRGGDRVLIIAENCREAGALLLACAAADAWAVMANARLTEAELAAIAGHARPRLVLAVTASPQARAHAAAFGLTPAAIPGLGDVLAGQADPASLAEPVHASGAAQCAVLAYTSGSSGAPKGVMLSHRNLLYMAAVSGAIRGLAPADRMLAVLPVSHIVGLAVVFLGALMHGASVRLMLRFTPNGFFQLLAEDGISIVLGAPALLALVLDHARANGRASCRAPSLRILSVSGAPLEPGLKAAAEDFFGLPLHHGYGITECGPTIAQIRPGAEREDCGVGPLLPGVEARLLGPDGAVVARAGAAADRAERTAAERAAAAMPAGVEPGGAAGGAEMPGAMREAGAAGGVSGELSVRGPGVMLGYYRDPARTAEVLDSDGWFRTGDLAQLTPDNLAIIGRAKSLIIRFGFNVIPEEVEAVLAAHPDVRHAAVLGRPGEGGEDIVAFIEPREGTAPDGAALARHAAAHLASYKRPTHFLFHPSLPLSPTGKVLKQALLDAAAEAPALKAAG